MSYNKKIHLDALSEHEEKKITLGLHSGYQWIHDPKHFLFSLSRYKFVSKMLSGYHNVLEIGCGDGFFSAIVKNEVGKLSLTDCEEINIQLIDKKNYQEVFLHDFVNATFDKVYDAIYALDVLEHIHNEDLFLSNAIQSLHQHGVMIIGMPSIESQVYASLNSRIGHVNCKSKADLKKVMSAYFHNVFMFSMNDEVLHTGFDAMSHYLIALCAGKK